jgi:acetyl esterase/lipase
MLRLTLYFAGLASAVLNPSVAGEAAAETTKAYKVRTVKDLTYYDGTGHDRVKHKLDLYLPAGKKDFPVMLFVHGGAWLHGDKSFLGFYGVFAQSLARQGIGVAVANYRLSPAVRHPEHVRDVARAFGWLHKNIARYGGSPDRMFVSGHSAGGHLVALLTADDTYLKAVGLTTKAIRAAIPISGVYNIPNGLLTKVFGSDPDAGKKASPLEYARKGLPPFLILYADKDFPVCGRKPSEEFCRALKDKGTDAKTVEIKNSNHYLIIGSAAIPTSPVARAVVRFIREHDGK